MRVLALSTATARASVAILDDGLVAAQSSYEDGMMHAERIFRLIDSVCAFAATTRDQIDALACDIGPGSFTGVRVGVATAKGICLGLGKPLFPAGALEAMAAAAFALLPPTINTVSPIVDAKRGEIFIASYHRGGSESAPAFMRRDRAEQHLAQLVAADHRFVGRAAADFELGDQVVEHRSCELPSAEWIARVALQQQHAPPLMDVEPNYVRGADATPMSAAPRK